MNQDTNSLVLNVPMCDYLTLTAWQSDYLKILFSEASAGEEPREGVKHENYTGYQSEHAFFGTGIQKGVLHHILQISGAISDEMAERSFLDDSDKNCSRIDLQITCPGSMDMWRFADRKKQGKRNVQYMEKKGLATVYIGSFLSDKLVRVYMKSKHMLRFEVMYKGRRAMPMWEALQMAQISRVTIGQFLRYELQSLNDHTLDAIFAHPLATFDPLKPPTLGKLQTSTEKWLRDTVMPVIAKYANSHDANADLLYALQLATQKIDEVENE